MRRIKIVHRTQYDFYSQVELGPHRLLLRPREGHELRIESSLLETEPAATLRWMRDIYDNSVAIASFDGPTSQLIIRSEVIVEHYADSPFDFLLANYAVNFPFRYESDCAAILRPFFVDPHAQDEQDALRDWLGEFWQSGETIETLSLLLRLCVGVKQTLQYQLRYEYGVQTTAETLRKRSGSCRDFASLFMHAARALGLAARFVSGYLDSGTFANASTHAWVEVYLPGAGWKGFDPTLGELVGSKHIPVAVARWPEIVSPVAGTFFGMPGSALYVDVAVTELYDPPVSMSS